MLLVHLHNHEATPVESTECAIDALPEHLSWKQQFFERVLDRARDRELIFVHEGLARLTADGRAAATRALT